MSTTVDDMAPNMMDLLAGSRYVVIAVALLTVFLQYAQAGKMH